MVRGRHCGPGEGECGREQDVERNGRAHLEYERSDPYPGRLCGVVATICGRFVGRSAGDLVEDGMEEH